MGTWGTGIFADDLASDIRGAWRDALTEGLTTEDAAERLLDRYKTSQDDPDESARFWMALAAAQSETGRLQDHVRACALAVIADGADVEQFDARDRARRRKAIAALEKRLLGPQRAPVALKQAKAVPSPVSVGDVIKVTGERRSALFLVVGSTSGYPPGTQWPVLAALRWDGDDVPPRAVLQKLPLVRDRSDSGHIKHPIVDFHAVSGPSRGPRSFPHFGTVVAQGILRPDSPRVPEPGELNWYAMISYAGWPFLPGFVDGEWFERQLAITDEWEEARPKGLRALIWRLDNLRRRKAAQRKMRKVLGALRRR
jgi:hypothetical protein